MKILHVNSYYYASKFYKHLYDEQFKMGLNIKVLVPIPKNTEKSSFDFGDYTEIRENHYKIQRLVFTSKHNSIVSDFISVPGLNDFDIIHAHSLFSNGKIAFELNKMYGIPYIVTVRNTDLNLFFKKMIHLRKIGIEIMHKADRVVFLSESYKDETIHKFIPKHLRKDMTSKSVVIPNGLDNFWLENIGSPKHFNIGNRELNVIQVGDINKNKNIESTLKSVNHLNQQGFNISLRSAGKIKDKQVYTRLDKSENFEYLGILDKIELIDAYRQSDMFVMPSFNETFGLVYLEAMSQGLPLIYSKGQGFDNQFQEGHVGFSVDSYNHVEISEKIHLIIDNYDIISKNCINESKKYAWVNIASTFLQEYIRILLLKG